MKKFTKVQKQLGFFDLGISLIILLIGGTVVAVSAPEGAETSDEQVQVSMAEETTASENLTGYDFDIDD